MRKRSRPASFTPVAVLLVVISFGFLLSSCNAAPQNEGVPPTATGSTK